MKREDLRINTSADAVPHGEITMTVTHLPTGLHESGTGRSELRLRNELVERLRRRLMEDS